MGKEGCLGGGSFEGGHLVHQCQLVEGGGENNKLAIEISYKLQEQEDKDKDKNKDKDKERQ